MREDDFLDLIIDQWENMEFFFLNRIRKAKIRRNEEEITDELINLTYLEVWEIIQANKYLNYNLKALLITKAKNVWSAFIKDNNHPLRRAIELETYSKTNTSTHDPYISFELRDELKYLETRIPKATYEIFTYMSQGYSYEEISKKINKSVTSIKQLIFRQREKLRKIYRK